MTPRGSSAARGVRSKWWLLFLVCLLALAASVHFYILYAAKSATAARAQEASRQARVTLTGVRQGIVVAENRQKQIKAKKAAHRKAYLAELTGIPGTGSSGMSGDGPLARRDLMTVNEDSLPRADGFRL